VQGFFQRKCAFQADMEHENRLASLARQHHGTRFRDVTWPARPVDRERHIMPFLQTPRHHNQALQPAPRRTSLRRAKPEPLNNPPRPLTIEVRGVHHYGAAVAPPPNGGKNRTVPECTDQMLAAIVRALRMLPAQNFEAYRRTDNADDAINGPRNNRNLHAPPARKLRQPRIVMNINPLRCW